MTMTRVLPPNSVGTDSITANGRFYSTSNGAALDVPDFDASVLCANGWHIAAAGGSGATSARPMNVPKSTVFYDSTLAALIVWDGKAWRNKITGVAA